MKRISILAAWFLLVALPAMGQGAVFKAGVASRDITPQEPVPMWGYGARHDLLSQGALDALYAKALVLEAGDSRLGIVTTDIGRGPTEAMLKRVREAVREHAGVTAVLISGSHTHHGPVIELMDVAGQGKGKFDNAVAYAAQYEQSLIEVITEAANALAPAAIGSGVAEVDMNRNRQSKIEPKPRDTDLVVVQVESTEGKLLATLVNFAAHPTMRPGEDLRFSADYCGAMMRAVEDAIGGQCMFVQGAAGDMSVLTTDATNTPETFGQALAEKVLAVCESIDPAVPAEPVIQVQDHRFPGDSRIDLSNPMIQKLLKSAFFDEFVEAFMVELHQDTIEPVMTTALINHNIYFVGVSGEFFSNHAVRLKERIRDAQVVFQGYCNGHHLYFPTIEQAAEGGYGADSKVSWVPLGKGEEMMNQAVIDYYTAQGKLEDAAP